MDLAALKELIGFVGNPKQEMRLIAVQHLVGYTATAEGLQALKQTDAVSQLVRRLTDIHKIGEDAHRCLINMTSDPEVAEQLVAKNVIHGLLDSVLDSLDPAFAELSAQLLCNLTTIPAGAGQVLQVDEQDVDLRGFLFSKLATTLFQCSPTKLDRPLAVWVAHIILNVTQHVTGRTLLLDPERQLIRRVLPYMAHPSLDLRRSACGIVRNCCFEKNSHHMLLQDDIDVLTHVLYPLRGAEFYSKQDDEGLPRLLSNQLLVATGGQKNRENDPQVRLLLVESLLQLSTLRESRDVMRAKNVFAVIEKLYAWETDAAVTAATQRLVEQLMLSQEAVEAELSRPDSAFQGRVMEMPDCSAEAGGAAAEATPSTTTTQADTATAAPAPAAAAPAATAVTPAASPVAAAATKVAAAGKSWSREEIEEL